MKLSDVKRFVDDFLKECGDGQLIWENENTVTYIIEEVRLKKGTLGTVRIEMVEGREVIL